LNWHHVPGKLKRLGTWFPAAARSASAMRQFLQTQCSAGFQQYAVRFSVR
jgi:hypothetical protein